MPYRPSLRVMSWLLGAASVVATAWAAGRAAEIAERSRDEPLVTYWAGPGTTMPVNDRSVAQLSAGGWNVGWASCVADLDVYHRHGLRGMLVVGTPDLDDPLQAESLDRTIRGVRGHPALFAYHLVDEPGAGAFAGLARLAAFLRDRDPATLAYVNLLPTYAGNGMLGVGGDTTTAYREYLRLFIAAVAPRLLSYDHYHFKKESDGDQYFLNIGLVREAALAARVPFLNIVQACDSPDEGWRGPQGNELRWLTYTSLAYGAAGISHFRYDTGLCRGDGEPNELYWTVSGLNREFVAITNELREIASTGVRHRGRGPEVAEVPGDAGPIRARSDTADLLVGEFGTASAPATHVLVVNLDYRAATTAVLEASGPVAVFHAPTRRWSAWAEPATVRLELPPGGGVLVRRGG